MGDGHAVGAVTPYYTHTSIHKYSSGCICCLMILPLTHKVYTVYMSGLIDLIMNFSEGASDSS